MKCSSCFKQVEQSCTKNENSVHQSKRLEIQNLRQQLNQQRAKYNQVLQKNFNSKIQMQRKKPNHVNQQKTDKSLFSQQLAKIAKKQNTLVPIKSLKQKIENKKVLLQRYKQRRNQKFNQINGAESNLKKFKHETLIQSQQQLNELKKAINDKAESIKHLSKVVKKYLKQIVDRDFASMLTIHRMFRIRESEKLFQVKKVDELDFMNYQRLTQSFYELENIEEIVLKNKTSEKCIHVLFENILILQIVQKVCKFWLPYPIECRMDFRQSRLISKVQQIRVSGHKLIDFGKTVKLSNNIMQFFNEQSFRESIRNDTPNPNEETPFQEIKPEFDQTIQYNQRRYALNKQFINFLQVNIEFLSLKYGIQKRPFVFLQCDLMHAIQKQFIWRHSYFQLGKLASCPIQFNPLGYNSMLKELKLAKMIESLQNINTLNASKEQTESTQMIPEVEQSQQGVQNNKDAQKQTEKSQTIFQAYFGTFSKYFVLEKNEDEINVPEFLEHVISNSTDNDQFEVLAPET